MANKIIRLQDTMNTTDKLDIESANTGFDTEVIIRAHNINKDGDHSIKVLHNKTVLGGRTKLLEDCFPVRINNNQHLFINDNVLGEYEVTTGQPVANAIQVQPTDLNNRPRMDPKYFRDRQVQYWCAGNGALNKTVLTSSYDSHSTNTKLYNMIPFRLIKVDEPLSDTDRAMYKMEVVYPATHPLFGYKGYYFKKIIYNENMNGINMKVDGLDYIPKWNDTTPDLELETGGVTNAFKGNKVQQNYIDMNLNIASEEFKEYFEAMDKSLGNAYISEIGLVCGLDCENGLGIKKPMSEYNKDDPGYNDKALRSEIYDAELFAHLTFDPYTVSRTNATINFEYRIFS